MRSIVLYTGKGIRSVVLNNNDVSVIDPSYSDGRKVNVFDLVLTEFSRDGKPISSKNILVSEVTIHNNNLLEACVVGEDIDEPVIFIQNGLLDTRHSAGETMSTIGREGATEKLTDHEAGKYRCSVASQCSCMKDATHWAQGEGEASMYCDDHKFNEDSSQWHIKCTSCDNTFDDGWGIHSLVGWVGVIYVRHCDECAEKYKDDMSNEMPISTWMPRARDLINIHVVLNEDEE